MILAPSPAASDRRTRRRAPAFVAAIAAVSLVAGCGADDGSGAEGNDDRTTPRVTTPDRHGAATGTGTATAQVFDTAVVHALAIRFDDADYKAMLTTYSSSGDKDWIKASVTLDGVQYSNVGIRLKGNSSLRNLVGSRATSAPAAERLPWLVRLDKYEDGQAHQGVSDFVVRSNNSQTSLNEAVALELLDRADLASQRAMATSFTANGSTPVLRLVVELPEDQWMERTFSARGALFKAESTGDWSYRGDDEASYDEIFDQEAGDDNADLGVVIDLLEFLNRSNDATFDAELARRLDVDAFARYLAMQDLVGNFDDIDGPGNNSYLYFDTRTEKFTVVPWDLNLAFGTMVAAGVGGGPGIVGAPGGAMPGGQGNPAPGGGARTPNGGGARGPGGRTNILVQRFHASSKFEALYQQQLSALRAQLYTSGTAKQILDRCADVLQRHATTLVSSATITQEAARIAAYFSA